MRVRAFTDDPLLVVALPQNLVLFASWSNKRMTNINTAKFNEIKTNVQVLANIVLDCTFIDISMYSNVETIAERNVSPTCS